MTSIIASNLGLVPTRRLGVLLAERREAYGYSLPDMARRSMGRFGVEQLEAIEAGNTDLDDTDIESLSLLYEFNSTPPRPQRSKLIVADDEDVPMPLDALVFDDGLVESVPVRYVALLHLLRNVPIGEPLPLRSDDMDLLAEAFSLTPDGVSSRIERIKTDATAEIAEQAERMRRRLVVPAAGLLVGPTPAGMLILVK